VTALADEQICGMFVVDIAGFCGPERDDDVQAYVRKALYAILQASFDGADLPWRNCLHEDRGDGVLVVIPGAVGAGNVIDPLLERLRGMIRRHNRMSCFAARIQLRAAAHIGFVRHDGEGLVGDAVNHLFRLLDAPPLRQRLAASDAELAFIASDWVYESVVRRHPTLVDPGLFEPVRVRVKQTGARAWIYVPGAPARREASKAGHNSSVSAVTTDSGETAG
jgi:hypothetical protein